jgi:hypothetical protein
MPKRACALRRNQFPTNWNTSLTITPASDLLLFRLNRTRAGWGYDIRVEICDESADAIQVINFVAVCQE